MDEVSCSTSEIFAAGMQEAGRAVVVGRRTPGAALPSFFSKLPNGDFLQWVAGSYHTPRGQVIEGVGVMPDVE